MIVHVFIGVLSPLLLLTTLFVDVLENDDDGHHQFALTGGPWTDWRQAASIFHYLSVSFLLHLPWWCCCHFLVFSINNELPPAMPVTSATTTNNNTTTNNTTAPTLNNTTSNTQLHHPAVFHHHNASHAAWFWGNVLFHYAPWAQPKLWQEPYAPLCFMVWCQADLLVHRMAQACQEWLAWACWPWSKARAPGLGIHVADMLQHNVDSLSTGWCWWKNISRRGVVLRGRHCPSCQECGKEKVTGCSVFVCFHYILQPASLAFFSPLPFLCWNQIQWENHLFGDTGGHWLPCHSQWNRLHDPGANAFFQSLVVTQV